MPLTLDEIVEHEERLRREIVERECLLAAFKVLHGYAANGQSPKSMELSSIASALVPSAANLSLAEPATQAAPAQAKLPAPPPPAPYIHPELNAIGSRHGRGTEIVRWAIQRMTDNYTLREIAALLEREGRPMTSAEISVVLTRLKNRGEVEEIKPGSGRTAAIFRKPESATPPETESVDQIDAAAPTIESAQEA